MPLNRDLNYSGTKTRPSHEWFALLRVPRLQFGGFSFHGVRKILGCRQRIPLYYDISTQSQNICSPSTTQIAPWSTQEFRVIGIGRNQERHFIRCTTIRAEEALSRTKRSPRNESKNPSSDSDGSLGGDSRTHRPHEQPRLQNYWG